jgi:hypothetical protein
MNTNIINIFGFINASNQFEVKSSNVKSKFNKKNDEWDAQPNMSEYFLSGFVAFLEAIAQKLALEHQLSFKSLQIEVVAQNGVATTTSQTTQQFFPFQKIEVAFLPFTEHNSDELGSWIKEIQEYINPPQDLVSVKLSDKIVYPKAA